jgi:hypothetical protein
LTFLSWKAVYGKERREIIREGLWECELIRALKARP